MVDLTFVTYVKWNSKQVQKKIDKKRMLTLELHTLLNVIYTLDIYPLYRTLSFLLLVCGETVSTNTV